MALLILALQLGGCGGDDPADDAPAVEPPAVTTEEAAPIAEPAIEPGTRSFALTPADLDAYEQGLRREIELLRAARERLQQAANDDEQLEILGAIQPRELRREGAAAAGVAEDRYERITSAVNDVLGKREMAAASQQMAPSAAELESMPAELRARVEENMREAEAAWGDPYAGLGEDTAQALQQRQDELAGLRAEHIGLLAQPFSG
jgi:hypothetical protein